MATTARPKTLNRGAADAIARVIAKVDRMADPSGYVNASQLKTWLQDWDKRAAKKAGGLGRK